MRRLFRCFTGSRRATVQPDGLLRDRHNKMHTSRLHSVGIALQIEVHDQTEHYGALKRDLYDPLHV